MGSAELALGGGEGGGLGIHGSEAGALGGEGFAEAFEFGVQFAEFAAALEDACGLA